MSKKKVSTPGVDSKLIDAAFNGYFEMIRVTATERRDRTGGGTRRITLYKYHKRRIKKGEDTAYQVIVARAFSPEGKPLAEVLPVNCECANRQTTGAVCKHLRLLIQLLDGSMPIKLLLVPDFVSLTQEEDADDENDTPDTDTTQSGAIPRDEGVECEEDNRERA